MFLPIRTLTKYRAIIELCEDILLPNCEDYLGHTERDVQTQHLILKQSDQSEDSLTYQKPYLRKLCEVIRRSGRAKIGLENVSKAGVQFHVD